MAIFDALKREGGKAAVVTGAPDDRSDYYNTLIDDEFNLFKVAAELLRAL